MPFGTRGLEVVFVRVLNPDSLVTGDCVELLADNCHDGIEGLPTNEGRDGDGEGERPELRLKRSAFRDFNSCCSSASD